MKKYKKTTIVYLELGDTCKIILQQVWLCLHLI